MLYTTHFLERWATKAWPRVKEELSAMFTSNILRFSLWNASCWCHYSISLSTFSASWAGVSAPASFHIALLNNVIILTMSCKGSYLNHCPSVGRFSGTASSITLVPKAFVIESKLAVVHCLIWWRWTLAQQLSDQNRQNTFLQACKWHCTSQMKIINWSSIAARCWGDFPTLWEK